MNLSGREGAWKVQVLDSSRARDAVAALCDAFRGYPVLDYVLDRSNPLYEEHALDLVTFFVSARFLRGEPVLGIEDEGAIVAAALVTLPGRRPSPPALADLREELWSRLGSDARARYEHLGEAFSRFEIDRPHCHLNMIGVRRSYAGRGLAGALLRQVHLISQQHPESEGVTLNTETRSNCSLYEHFGYRPLGHVVVAPGLDTWGFFRPDEAEI